VVPKAKRPETGLARSQPIDASNTPRFEDAMLHASQPRHPSRDGICSRLHRRRPNHWITAIDKSRYALAATSSDSTSDRGATNRRMPAWTTHCRRLCLEEACRRPRGPDPRANTLCSSASCSLTRVRPLAAPDHIPFMKRAGKPWVSFALIPE
jgi:hypothetical protein